MKPALSAALLGLLTLSAIAMTSVPALGQPAPIFQPVLPQIRRLAQSRRSNPPGWIARLPSASQTPKRLVATFYDWNSNINILLSSAGCPDPGSGVCIAGRIVISKSNVLEMSPNITLAPGVYGYYSFGDAANGNYQHVEWRQDNQTYEVNGRMQKSEIVQMAKSMATAKPILLR